MGTLLASARDGCLISTWSFETVALLLSLRVFTREIIVLIVVVTYVL